MRAIETVALGALLIWLVASPARGDPECITIQETVERARAEHPDLRHSVYTGFDSKNIQSGLIRTSGLTLTGQREFLVFLQGQVALLIGFKDGCMEERKVVLRAVLDSWLAGTGAQR